MQVTGAGRSTLTYWYRNRDTNGHPERIRDGRRVFYDAGKWHRWWKSYQAAQDRNHSKVVRSANDDPDELVPTAVASQIMGYSHADVVRSLYNDGYFPEPDHVELASTGAPRRLFWKRSTLWAHAENRDHRGRPATSRPAAAKRGNTASS